MAKRRERREELWRERVEQSRRVWLGRAVSFVHYRDGKTRVGVVTEVLNDGTVMIEYRPGPGRSASGLMSVDAGSESEVLTLVQE